MTGISRRTSSSTRIIVLHYTFFLNNKEVSDLTFEQNVYIEKTLFYGWIDKKIMYEFG
jgi:hypothetical protein